MSIISRYIVGRVAIAVATVPACAYAVGLLDFDADNHPERASETPWWMPHLVHKPLPSQDLPAEATYRSTLPQAAAADGAAPAAPTTPLVAPPPKGWGGLSTSEWQELELLSKQPVSRNTTVYRFRLPDETSTAGMPVASCILAAAKCNTGEASAGPATTGMVVRPYTPISESHVTDHFELMVKEYEKGAMSRHIASMEVGDTLAFKGPFTKLKYEPNMKKEIGMIAGGTGVTPMLQLIREVLKNDHDHTKISLVFANVSDKDILLKPELDALAKKHSNFKVHYVVDKPTGWFWRGGTGYITQETVAKHMPAPSEDALVLVCGPPQMQHFICGRRAPNKTQGELVGILKDAGYTEDMVYKF